MVLRPGIHTPSAYSTHTHTTIHWTAYGQSMFNLLFPHSYGRGH